MEHQLAKQPKQKEQPEKSPSPLTPGERAIVHPILQLQRAVGNKAVQRMVSSEQMAQSRVDIAQQGTENDTQLLSNPELQTEYELTRQWLLQHNKNDANYASTESYFRILEQEVFQRGNASMLQSTTSQTASTSVHTTGPNASATEQEQEPDEQDTTVQIMNLLNSPDGFDLKAAIDLLMTLEESSSIDPKYKVTEWLHKHKKDTDLPVGAEHSVRGIENTKKHMSNEGKLSTLEYFGKVSIDIDGVSYNLAIDPDSQPRTTLKVVEGKTKTSLDAYTVPYAVLSGTFRDVLGKNTLPPGILGLIEYKGRYVATVLGDIGPHRSTGEASAYAVRQLGLPVKVVKSKSKKKERLVGGLDEPKAHYYFFAGTAPKGSLKRADVTPEAIKTRLEGIIKQRLLDHMRSTQVENRG